MIHIPRHQLRLAFRWVWAIVTVAIATVLAAGAILPADRVLAMAPVCERKRTAGQDCMLCGSTHAFILISRGRFGDASRQNRGSVPLYAGLFLNEGLFVLYMVHGFNRSLKESS